MVTTNSKRQDKTTERMALLTRLSWTLAITTFSLVITNQKVTAQDTSRQTSSNSAQVGPTSFQCHCMEYWECIGAGGKPYSYCAYSNKVCCFVDGDSKGVGILPKPTKKKANCGKKGFDSGKEGVSEAGEWAWHAAILEKPNDLYVCGASLLDEFWVLTAAHCVDDYKSVSKLKVRLGEHDVTNTAERFRHEEFDVSRIVLHPSFNNNTLLHDIALVKLAKPARKRPNINVVCMPETNMEFAPATSKCFVTGWGRKTETSEHSVVLKEVRVPMWKSDDCQKALQAQFGPAYRLPPTVVCAGAEGQDACDGDGGGPMVCEKNGVWHQVGVVSFGIGCGRPNTPGVYTKVDSYNDWIHEVVLNS